MAFMLCKHLVFMDTFQFMASSLEKLAANPPADAFKYTSRTFQNKKLELMKKKVIIHMISWIVYRSLMINSCHPKMISTVSSTVSIFLISSINTRKKTAAHLS